MFKRNHKGFSLIEVSVVILIIGILISGVAQALDMIDEANLKGARTASKGSRVSRTRDLVLWLDATADGASLTSANKQAVEGGDVTKWKDSNPNSINGFALAGTAKYNASKISGLPGISLDTASSNYLKLTSKFDTSAVDYTIYLVYQPVDTSASVIMEKRNATPGLSFPYKLEIDSSGFYKFSDSVASVTGTKKPSAGKTNLIRLSRSTGGVLTIVVDDVPATGVGGTAVNSEELIIGAKNGTTIANFIKGRIGELIIFERDLAASEEADIEKYLAKKWKLAK